MAEIDYQMALVLQYRFEQEDKRKENTLSDHQLALQLQEQFKAEIEQGTSTTNYLFAESKFYPNSPVTNNKTGSDHLLALELQQQFKAELEVEQPANNLVYDSKKGRNSSLNNSKCLVDPSWEVIDPTPDIHVLFLAFNERFFGNALQMVTVSWSKRMTTCAGICSYQGRGGLCSITLSEPLLKLRPRKDLVETLLHEMIHAYLFVTNNNRDRDGHGPEFHKHMYRINSQAGTNITVYHDFHDEVRLYQQHWWRCDGPCQKWKPYFGMVRRATNRAPGQYDRWWGEHSRNCGGTFVKVKEPEKLEKKALDKRKSGATAPSKTNPKNDIRNYIPTISKTTKIQNKNKENQSIPDTTSVPGTSTNTLSNIRTISNNTGSNPKVTNVISSKTSNIFGFTNLNSGTPKAHQKRPGSFSGAGIKGAVKNAGSSTFVVTKKGSASTKEKNCDSSVVKPASSLNNIEVFSGPGRTLSASSASSSSDYSVVRNHWLKKFENNTDLLTNNRTSIKRPNNCLSPSSTKVPRTSGLNRVECPVCGMEFDQDKLNEHLDQCLESPGKRTKECVICGNDVAEEEYQNHIADCSKKNFNDDFEEADLKECPFCHMQIEYELFESHSVYCVKNVAVEAEITKDEKNCPVCKHLLSRDDYDSHVERCLLKMYDDLEDKYDLNKDANTSCLACNKQIRKNELDSHLEDCLSMSNVFDATHVSIKDDDDDKKESENDMSICDKDQDNNSYNCPFCLKLVLEKEMQGHLDHCLSIAECTSKVNKEKSFLVDTLCSNDFYSD